MTLSKSIVVVLGLLAFHGVHPFGLVHAEEIVHENLGDWKVQEWKAYQNNECVLSSSEDLGDSISLQFVDSGSRDYSIGVTDAKRRFPERLSHDKAIIQVDHGNQIDLGTMNLFSLSPQYSHFKPQQIYFSFKTVDDFFLLIEQLRLGGRVFFFYDPDFEPTLVNIGRASDALDDFVKCIKKYR